MKLVTSRLHVKQKKKSPKSYFIQTSPSIAWVRGALANLPVLWYRNFFANISQIWPNSCTIWQIHILFDTFNLYLIRSLSIWQINAQWSHLFSLFLESLTCIFWGGFYPDSRISNKAPWVRNTKKREKEMAKKGQAHKKRKQGRSPHHLLPPALAGGRRARERPAS